MSFKELCDQPSVSQVMAQAHTNLHGVVHLGGHQFAGCHDDILALLAGKVTVDIPGVFEQVCGIALQILHLLQRLLELCSFLDHLRFKYHKTQFFVCK